MPGIKRDELEVTLEEGRLTISGERTLTKDEAVKSYVSERTPFEFRRSFELPSPVCHDAVTAKLNDGVLEVTIPKAPLPESQKIDIAIG